jgi:hypothetical protein
MIKALRFLAICMIGAAFAASSIARAQTYTQVDYPGAVDTSINGGPNPQGTSVGSWFDGTDNHGFSLTADGVFTSFDPPGSIATTPNFINPQGVIVGGYYDGTSMHGFILNGGNYTIVNVPGAAGTELTGINPLGNMSGATCSDPACGTTGNANTSHSFALSTKGVYKFFDPRGATTSSASTISPSLALVGAYTDDIGELTHGYLLPGKPGGKYSTIDFPGATTGTFAGGGNPANDIVGIYNFVNCTTDCNHSFLLQNGVYTSFDYPETGVTLTDATGINQNGVIVGIFVDSAGVEHGFIRTP